METIQINRANAVKAHESASPEGRKLLETLLGPEHFIIDPMKRYGSWEDICEAAGIDPVNDLPYSAPKTKKQVSLNGAFKVETICDAFNFREEFATAFQPAWEADYADEDQYKHYCWMVYDPSVSAFVFDNTDFTYTFTALGSRLCTDTEPKAKYIWNTFQKEWNEFLNPSI